MTDSLLPIHIYVILFHIKVCIIMTGASQVSARPSAPRKLATGGSVSMEMKERLKLIPYETAVGLTLAVISTLIYGVFQFLG